MDLKGRLNQINNKTDHLNNNGEFFLGFILQTFVTVLSIVGAFTEIITFEIGGTIIFAFPVLLFFVSIKIKRKYIGYGALIPVVIFLIILFLVCSRVSSIFR